MDVFLFTGILCYLYQELPPPEIRFDNTLLLSSEPPLPLLKALLTSCFA